MSHYRIASLITHHSSSSLLFRMEFVLIKLLFCLILVRNGAFQQVRPEEMEHYSSVATFSEGGVAEECELALKQKLYPEIPYVYYYCKISSQQLKEVIVAPRITSGECFGFDCWESQLTDASKVEITKIMNTYRHKVAENKCKKCQLNKNRVIFELRWAYYMEKRALELIKVCSRNISILNLNIPDDEYYKQYKLKNVILDYVQVTFETRTGLQREMRKILWKLMSENHLLDWDDQWQFRRGQMTEVGCVYLLRRNIDFYTSLGENVKSGNVGHLACSFFAPVEVLQPQAGHPFIGYCLPSIPAWYNAKANITLNSENDFYPSLCRVPFNRELNVGEASNDCVLDDFEFCNSSYTKNPITWQEKHYGFTLMGNIVQNNNILQLHVINTSCDVPKDIPIGHEEGANIFNYNCTLKQEVHVQADPQRCSNWNCEDSQLRDVTKLSILKSLNQGRHLVASGQCSPNFSSNSYCTNYTYCNMANVRWHWFLEEKASDIVKNCPNQEEFKEEEFEDEPFRDPVTYESISLVFDLPASQGQTALGEIFSKLFWNNSFNDWDSNGIFRRGNALWIGCSVIQRPNTIIPGMKSDYKLDHGIATHMTCIYAALHNKFETKFKLQGPCCQTCTSNEVSRTRPCQVYLVPNIAPFNNLCTSTLLEITMNCEINHCKEKNHASTAWSTFYKGVTVFQHVNGSFITEVRAEVKTDKPNPHPQVIRIFKKKYCWILVLILLVITAVWFLFLSLLFKYFSEEKSYKASLSTPVKGRESKK